MNTRLTATRMEHGAWQYSHDASGASCSTSTSTSNESRTSRIETMPRAPGFSLAEVLIALAITSFALLALIGVLPEGLRSLQNAQRNEAEARIVQHEAARFQLKPWDELIALMQGEDEEDFDGNGAPVEMSSNDAVYRARAEVMEAAPLPNETAASPYLRRLRIRIANRQQGAGAFDNPAQYRERWVTLVDLDKTPPVTVTAGATGTPTTGASATNP